MAVLILTGALIYLMDFLAVTTHQAVGKKDLSWLWGAPKAAPAQLSASARPTSLGLQFTVSGDQLTAQLTVVAQAGTDLAGQLLAAESTDTSDSVVAGLVGQISLAQFRNGITGSHHEWTTLRFGPPQLDVTAKSVTATFSSSSYRLLLDQQYIYLDPPAAAAGNGPGNLQFAGPSGVQLVSVTGARVTSTDGGDIGLMRDGSAMSAVLREPGRNWTTGLRSIGGVTLPIIGAALQRLAGLVDYLVLFWALSLAGRTLAGGRRDARSAVAASRNAVGAIIGGLTMLAILGVGYQLVFQAQPPRNLLAPELAGPVGLMVAGTVVLWPAACWRVTPGGGDRGVAAGDGGPGGPGGRAWLRWLRRAAMPAIAGGYLIVVYAWLGGRTDWLVVPATAGIAVLVYLLGTVLLSRRDRPEPVPWPVLAGTLAVILAATVAWPLLVYNSFTFASARSVHHVNVIGKWTYLGCALVALAGLCVMAARVVMSLAGCHIGHLSLLARSGRTARSPWARAKSACRVWRAVSAGVIVVILGATVRDLAVQSGVGDPHAAGLLPPYLAFYSGVFRALPQLLDWLFLALAVAVVLSVTRVGVWESRTAPEREADRIATRRIAIAIMMLILFSAYTYYYNAWVFSSYTWIYLPVTPLIGLMVLAWLVLPKKMINATATLPPGPAIERTLDAWRIAAFTDSQRQQIMGNADDLRQALKDGPAAYEKTLTSLTMAQTQLASLHDIWQRKAHEYLNEAFDHNSERPDERTAWRSALTGAVLGLVPACVLLLATRPASGWSGYPVLDFLGFTGWILFIWPALGWAIGYFLPFIRGGNGITKALWVYTAVAASLPMNLLWLDGSEWSATAIYYLELFAFLLILSVIVCDLMALRSAGISALTWIQLHNWKFLVTWSTAVLAAIGTAAATFLSTAATDLGHEASTVITGQGTPSSATPAKPGP